MRCSFNAPPARFRVSGTISPASFQRALVSVFAVALFGSVAACGSGGAHDSPPGNEDPAGPGVSPEDGKDLAGLRSLDLTLYVEEHAGVDRLAEPVRSGVPVPRAVQLLDTDGIEVIGPDGNAVPSQVRVTSRWGGAPDDPSRPIKWLLVDFPATVASGETGVYRLRTGAGQPEPASMVSETADRIVVETGAARFELSRSRFNLFDSVELADGSRLVTPNPDGGIYLMKPDGTRLLAAAGTAEVQVEENGPLRAVVVARGKHANGATAVLDWTVRLHFWKNRPDALVSYTFSEKDLDSIRNYVGVDEVGLTIPLSVGTSPRSTFGAEGDGGNTSHSAPLSNEAFLRQTGKLSEGMKAEFNSGKPDTIRYTTGGGVSGNGGKAPGWVNVSGSQGGVTAAMRWFWQQYPKKLAARPDALTMEIWPSEDVNLRVYAASQKTHEILYTFHDADVDPDSAGRSAAARMEAPLFARCNPAWYAGSWVWSRIGTADPGAYPTEHRETVDAYFSNLLGSEFPETFVNLRDHGKNGAGHSYSMWDFGDGRESAWSNGAYDTTRSLLIHYAITGDRAFLERGLESALHTRDVDIEHSRRHTRQGIREDRGVPAPWLGRSRYNPSEGPQSHDLGYEGSTGYGFEHHKGQGLADHYFLTGDMLSREVLAETYHYYEQWRLDAESGYLRTGGTRTVSHMLLVLLGYHDAYGTAESKARIEYLVDYLDAWQRETSSRDPEGHIWLTDDGKTSAFMNAITAESLILYELNFPDGIPVRQNLIDAVQWTVDPDNGQFGGGSQGTFVNAWTDNNYGVSHATVLDAMMGPMLAYGTDASGDLVPLHLAKELLENCIQHDASSPYIKAFTQQTRLVPGFLWYLQTPEARAEGGT